VQPSIIIIIIYQKQTLRGGTNFTTSLTMDELWIASESNKDLKLPRGKAKVIAETK